MDTCPICQGPATQWCKCLIGNRWCASKHEWQPCAVHREEKVIVTNDAQHDETSECTCHRKEEDKDESAEIVGFEVDEESEDCVHLTVTTVNLLKRVRALEDRLAVLEEERVTKKQKRK